MSVAKLKAKTKRLVLDAQIRSEYRWYMRRRQNSDGNVAAIVGDESSDGVDVAAQVVHDQIVASLEYNQVLVDAIESMGDKWSPSYVAKVIRKGIKSGVIQVESTMIDGIVTEVMQRFGVQDTNRGRKVLAAKLKVVAGQK